MAIWHFRVELVPRKAVVDFYGEIPIAIPEQDEVQNGFWEHFKAISKIEASLSSRWPAVPHWDGEARSWGFEEGHQISVFYKGGRIEWVTAKIEARVHCIDFIGQLCDVARESDCLLLTSQVYVLEPNFEEILQRFSTSVAAKYLSDPGGTLKSLPEIRCIEPEPPQ